MKASENTSTLGIDKVGQRNARPISFSIEQNCTFDQRVYLAHNTQRLQQQTQVNEFATHAAAELSKVGQLTQLLQIN